MYLPLILFFIALLGILFMLGSKLALVRGDNTIKVHHHNHIHIDIDKIREQTLKHSKRFGYIVLFVTLRSFIKTSYLLKQKTLALVTKIEEKLTKNKSNSNGSNGEKEVSGYLKTIVEYRKKIRAMKHKIKEEEGIE
mgnify:CR=1 FL=1